mmetsp:Transcript_54383/g.90233  ORF Transcript_54383/g.90233 Transcript_54383/m.90233 type:complete len:261 (+) Transcript_54383:67-849(+)|eukprot:CAMPEP_0119312882 /NCGR_PEP_ID=MMETSP1333-20130426/27066_1 /TAXON_ID=418940 /ORGANISM="Scyphosphaera apsteinii, Strain RCC1455" /LENGTH=260 /DNA_ID=CAMNT_0007317563 /DNA_START=66 /DNA_END=848 /DNA_ORIENTATION=+
MERTHIPSKRRREDVCGEDRIRIAMDDAASQFVCAITQELPVDPVIAMDGHVYERIAIEEWIERGSGKSPMTNDQMGSTLLAACHIRNSLMVMVKSGALTGDKVDAWKQRLEEQEKVHDTKQRAMNGDSEAMYTLGRWSQLGEMGFTVNEKEALHWYQRASDAGSPVGMAALGSCYLLEIGVPRSCEFGLVWITEAASGGSGYACFHLGRFFKDGVEGLPVDTKMVYKWWSRARSCSEELTIEQEEEIIAWLDAHPQHQR